MKKTKTNKVNLPKGCVIDPNMKDHSNAPFFVKKTEQANEFIRKHGLPKELESKK